MKSKALTDRNENGARASVAARAECTQALKRKMAQTNQRPPVSKRPIAACNREQVGKE